MYDFSTTVSRRGTACIKWDTVPEDVIALSIADADWATAPAVLDGVRDRMNGHPVYGYGFDDGGFRDVVVQWFQRKYDFTLDKSWIVLLRGIVPALAELAGLVQGDVVAGTPNYSLLLSAPSRIGKRLWRSPMIERREGRILTYQYDLKDLEAKVGQGAQMLYLCNPHNPFGKIYGRDELERLADFARAHHLITVSDEIHAELVFEKPHVPWATVCQENAITLMAPGKICNMPGIPVAFAIVPDEPLRERIRQISGPGGPGALNLAAAKGAYSQACDPWKQALVDYLQGNRDWLAQQLHSRFPRARFPFTEGTYLQWIDLEEYQLGDATKTLLDRARISLTGGVGFGGTKHHVRLNFATSWAVLSEAIDRMEKALE